MELPLSFTYCRIAATIQAVPQFPYGKELSIRCVELLSCRQLQFATLLPNIPSISERLPNNPSETQGYDRDDERIRSFDCPVPRIPIHPAIIVDAVEGAVEELLLSPDVKGARGGCNWLPPVGVVSQRDSDKPAKWIPDLKCVHEQLSAVQRRANVSTKGSLTFFTFGSPAIANTLPRSRLSRGSSLI